MLPPGWGGQEGGGERAGPETEPKTLQPQAAAAGAAARVRPAGAALPPVAVRLPLPHKARPPARWLARSLTPLRRRLPTRARLNFPPSACSSATGGSPLPLGMVARLLQQRLGQARPPGL